MPQIHSVQPLTAYTGWEVSECEAVKSWVGVQGKTKRRL